eukprot:scaffold27837_cov133-Isochrysis_galbana.AAC.5
MQDAGLEALALQAAGGAGNASCRRDTAMQPCGCSCRRVLYAVHAARARGSATTASRASS